MASEIVTQCPDLSVSSAFDPQHFHNWWINNGKGIDILLEALGKYRDDLAGKKLSENIEVAAGLYNSWLNREDTAVAPYVGAPEEYSSDTQKLLKVLHSKVFSRDPAELVDPARILVAGDVQSGKTGAYTELIKALIANRGIRGFPERYIFLVLGGVHNKLRLQTQERLSSELAASEEKGDLVWLTSTERDIDTRAAYKISGEGSASYVAVVKKVASRLDAAAEVFAVLPDSNDFAVVIIDDECDQITPDTSKKEKRNSRRVARLLWGKKTSMGRWSMPEKFSKNGLVYIGYTATPYSNVFLDDEREMSMYPSTYMHVLTPGEGYMGYDHYWPQDATSAKNKDVFKATDGEINERRGGPNKFKVAETALEQALLWFLVAACIKRERLKAGKIDLVDRHTSMLVHAHVRVTDHKSMRSAVYAYMQNLAKDWRDGASGEVKKRLLDTFRTAKGAEDRPASVCREPDTTVENLLQKHLPDVFDNLKIVCDNSRSTERLAYPDDREPTAQDTIVEVIAVGGYTLSRGITLRGLVSSYVSRITKVVYDTYLQLCRWFGYRRGYEDLTRLWVAKNVSDTYADIARVDRQFKKAITDAGLDPEGPYGHEQIYLGTVAGALPSSTLDSLIRSTAFKGGDPFTPYGNRLFGPSAAWDDTDVDSLVKQPRCKGTAVANFLEQYKGPDETRIKQLVNFIRENKDLLECDWDVKRPVKDKDPGARFERNSKIVDGADVWYVKTTDDKKWRKAESRPLLVVAPASILPPAQTPNAAPRIDWIVAAMFNKSYGPAEMYRNDSIKLREDQDEEFESENAEKEQV